MSAPRVTIIGAGPSGMSAAIAAAECGLAVTVVDDFAAPGGQVYRAIPGAFSPRGAQPPEYVRGEALRRRFFAAAIDYLPRHRAWHAGDGLDVEAIGPDGRRSIAADALILATGATERVVPFDGWTLPGVIGLAAATILLKADRMAPGREIVVAGRGPLLFAVAEGALKAGARVVAIVDARERRDWLANAPRMLARPDQLGRGLAWLGSLRRAAVPVLAGHRLRRVARADGRLVAEAVPIGGTSGAATATFRADVVCVGDGLTPETSLSRLLGLDHHHDALRGGLVPSTGLDGRTSRERVYVTGDAAGIAGALAAVERGRITGLAAALDLGRLSPGAFRRKVGSARLRLAAADTFAGASRNLMAVSPDDYAGIGGDTIVCRCEDVTRTEIEAAIAAGTDDVNQIKSWTRCGMGPCQARMCGATLAALVAGRAGPDGGSRLFTPRAPVRPIAIDDLIGPAPAEADPAR